MHVIHSIRRSLVRGNNNENHYQGMFFIVHWIEDVEMVLLEYVKSGGCDGLDVKLEIGHGAGVYRLFGGFGDDGNDLNMHHVTMGMKPSVN